MTLGSGIAIAGIWIGVGLCGVFIGPLVFFVALCAALATVVVVEGDKP